MCPIECLLHFIAGYHCVINPNYYYLCVVWTKEDFNDDTDVGILKEDFKNNDKNSQELYMSSMSLANQANLSGVSIEVSGHPFLHDGGKG